MAQANPQHDQIRIADVEELRYWTKTLGVSSDALVSAIRAVGHSPEKVREYLGLPVQAAQESAPVSEEPRGAIAS